MLSKTQFKNYVKKVSELQQNREKLIKLGIELDLIYEDFYVIMDMVIESNFDEVGTDAYFGYVYENTREVTDNGEKYYFDNLDDLWNFMVKHYNYEPTKEIPCIY